MQPTNSSKCRSNFIFYIFQYLFFYTVNVFLVSVACCSFIHSFVCLVVVQFISSSSNFQFYIWNLKFKHVITSRFIWCGAIDTTLCKGNNILFYFFYFIINIYTYICMFIWICAKFIGIQFNFFFNFITKTW